ncbi:nucleoside-diphosphate sugar epimerase/dehydratase [Flavobacterium sp. 3HN19-14]|uniref:nucleoside-diphosphate sugar epimerase/dehydratase n=1 Tax=Flavobacterium sp. 3HN19-14 TaxID=3448133 RepID=UPI003EE276E8
MSSKNKIHFEISERKILLRIFDVIFVFIFLYGVDNLLEFRYLNFSSNNIYWILVLGLYINLLGTVFEMYNLQVASNQFQIIRSIVLTACTTVLFYLLTPIFTPLLPLSRLQIFYFFIAILGGLFFWRILYQKFLASHRFEKKAIIVCDNDEIAELVEGLQNVDPHYRIVGFLNSDLSADHFQYKNIKNVNVGELKDFVTRNSVSEIVIASQKKQK